LSVRKAIRKSKPRRLPIDLSGLGARDELFRLSGARKRDPAVELWLSGEPAELRSLARTWFQLMRKCGNDVKELMHDGCPVACVEDAAFAYVNTFKHHVNVGFFNGAVLEDGSGLLEGSGKRMRHVKLKPELRRDVQSLGRLIEASYANTRARLKDAR
jgi:hypothetical protein